MPSGWTTVALTDFGSPEVADPKIVESAIRRVLRGQRGVEIWVPCHTVKVGRKPRWIWLVSGYAFVKSPRPDVLRAVEDHKVISHVVGSVSDAEIVRMRDQLQRQCDQTIAPGDKVLITAGPYSRIPATVVTELPDGQVSVQVELRTLRHLVALERAALELLEKREPVPRPADSGSPAPLSRPTPKQVTPAPSPAPGLSQPDQRITSMVERVAAEQVATLHPSDSGVDAYVAQLLETHCPDFASRLRDLIDLRSMSIDEVAAACRMPKSRLAGYLDGIFTKPPRRDRLILSKLLGVDL